MNANLPNNTKAPELKVLMIGRRFEFTNGFSAIVFTEHSDIVGYGFRCLELYYNNASINQNYDISAFKPTQRIEILKRVEEAVFNAQRAYTIPVQKCKIKKETLGYAVYHQNGVFIADAVLLGEKRVQIKLTEHGNNKELAAKTYNISVTAYKEIEDAILELSKAVIERQNKARQPGNTSASEQLKAARNALAKASSSMVPSNRIDFITERVLAGNPHYADYRKNIEQTKQMVRQEFIRFIDDGMYIKLVNSILQADMEKRGK